MANRKKRHNTRNRPWTSKTPPEDINCWVEWGGEMIWAVGFTSGGAPFGLTQAEYEACTLEPAEGEPDAVGSTSGNAPFGFTQAEYEAGMSEPEEVTPDREEIGNEELPF